MDFRGWTHPYDGKGRRRPYADLPKAVTGLVDDPYRSLAGVLRNDGGFAKDSTPFAEFLWADFFGRASRSSRSRRTFDGDRRGVEIRQDGRRGLPSWLERSARLYTAFHIESLEREARAARKRREQAKRSRRPKPPEPDDQPARRELAESGCSR